MKHPVFQDACRLSSKSGRTCVTIMPESIRAQPRTWTADMCSPSSSQLESAPKTASKLMMIAACPGSAYFCPKICSVKATPADMTPP